MGVLIQQFEQQDNYYRAEKHFHSMEHCAVFL